VMVMGDSSKLFDLLKKLQLAAARLLGCSKLFNDRADTKPSMVLDTPLAVT